MQVDRETLKHSMSRIAILSNEKYRGIRLTLSTGNLSIQANNPDQEEAEEELQVEYDEADMEIGFNVTYLIDVLNVLGSEKVQIKLKDSNSSAIMSDSQDESCSVCRHADAFVRYSGANMAIRQLSLTDFRNLRSTTLEFDSRVNLITGDNGSGKTSLLESIYVLCQADSFRTHQLRQCINHDKSSFLLFGRFEDFKAGLSKSDKKLEIHVNGESIKRRSELVRRVPVLVLNSDSFALISGTPQQRRTFIDWCLFHVEQSYANLWGEYRHALRQRNRLLKSSKDLNLLAYWDEHLVALLACS